MVEETHLAAGPLSTALPISFISGRPLTRSGGPLAAPARRC
jgi:hypothetical protein